MSPSAQAALLRVLQEQELERVGGVETKKVDVRLVAATNEDLVEAIKQGRFRSDLYYRLNVYPVTVPPLRDRIDDIPVLAEHFVSRYANMHGEKVAGITDKAMAMLRAYHWPGNIRELANIIERGVIVAPHRCMIETGHLFPNVDNDPDPVRIGGTDPMVAIADSLLQNGASIDEFEKVLLDRALEQSGGTVSKAARAIGISRATMDYRLKKVGLR